MAAKTAFAAPGVLVMQFNETGRPDRLPPAFPREFRASRARASATHGGGMADHAVLAANAAKIREALGG